MKVLLVNHTLDFYAGSETFTYALALELARLGHDVTCFSPRLGKLAERLTEQGIPVVSDLADGPDQVDIIHSHHRHESLLAFSRYPDTPMVLVCHGVLPWQEQPMKARLNIHRYVAVSEEIRDHLVQDHGIAAADIVVLRNGVDLERFAIARPHRAAPRPGPGALELHAGEAAGAHPQGLRPARDHGGGDRSFSVHMARRGRDQPGRPRVRAGPERPRSHGVQARGHRLRLQRRRRPRHPGSVRPPASAELLGENLRKALYRGRAGKGNPRV